MPEYLWQIGQYISSNGGVVTAEELTPYLDVLPTNATTDDESYILPVLLRFDGHPEVNGEGSILYRFPSLQRTAASQRSRRKEYFEEKTWSFRKAGASEKAMVIGLGALNLFGVVLGGTFALVHFQLLSARDMACQTVITSDRIVYSTEKDLSDQDLEAREWDRRYRELDRSD